MREAFTLHEKQFLMDFALLFECTPFQTSIYYLASPMAYQFYFTDLNAFTAENVSKGTKDLLTTLEIDLKPFLSSFPSMTRPSSIGEGVRFLNR